MRQFRQRVKEIAERIGFRYFFGDWTSANLVADTWKADDEPVFIDVLPISGTFEVYRGERLADVPQVMWAFMRRIPTADVAGIRSDSRDEIVAQCKEDWKHFLSAYNESGYFNIIAGEIPYNVIVEQFDEMYCGIMVTLPASLSEDICII